MIILTVDVWDTLIRRRCHPDNVKLETGRFILSKADSYIKDKNLCPEKILLLRQNIELNIGLQNQKQGYDDEYDIYEVLDTLVGKICSGIASNIKKAISNSAVDYELSYEMSVTYPDPYILNKIKEISPDRCYFLSDFYMPSVMVKEILDHHGLNKLDGGYCSCDIKLNKRSGRLFDWFKSQHETALQSSQHIHLGDNEWSDVKIPSKKGIHSELFLPEDEHSKRTKITNIFSNKGDSIKWLKTELEAANCNLSPIEKAGASHTLLFYGFAEYIIRDSHAKNIEKIFFFTREGEFFKQVYDLINKSLPESLKGPQSNLLEVSRIATFLPSLREVSTAEMMRLWNLYSTQSFGALIKSLGLENDVFTKFAEEYGFSMDELIKYPWQDSRIKSLFTNPEFINTIEKEIDATRLLIDEYLESRGLSKHDNSVAIVDIGWRGTIQDNLCYIRSKTSITGYYLGLQQFLNEQPKNGRKLAFGPNINLSFKQNSLLNAVAPIEMICNSPNGSVTGYTKENSIIKAIKKTEDTENNIYFQFTKYYQKGILNTTQLIVDLTKHHRIDMRTMRNEGINVWQSIVRTPPEELASAYFNLCHNEVFGLGKMVDKKKTLSYTDLLTSPFSRKKRQKVVDHVKSTQWIEGYMRRRDIPKFKKYLLNGFLKMGLLLKKVLLRKRQLHTKLRRL